MKRFLLLILVFVMVLSVCLTACGKKGGGSKTPDSSTTGGDETSVQRVLGFPEDLNYNNDKFVILTYDPYVPEFVLDAASDAVGEAQLKRDWFIEEALNLEISVKMMRGCWSDRASFRNTVTQNVMSGSKSWDLIGAYSWIPPMMAIDSTIIDLRTTKYLDFDKAWWPQYMVDACTVKEKTYFCSGDISTMTLEEMCVIFFNINLATTNGIDKDHLYQMVFDGKWTVESFFETIEDASIDDGNGIWDGDDFYGFAVTDHAVLDAFYYSSGLTVYQENIDGEVVVSGDPTGEKLFDIVDIIRTAIRTYRSMYVKSTSGGVPSLEENSTIFAAHKAGAFVNSAEDNLKYGILPFPKYTAEGEYLTFLGNVHTQYCIPNDIDDYDRSAAVMQALGYAGETYVVPVVFEQQMKLRYAYDEVVSQMYDIIRAGCVTEMSALYGDAYGLYDGDLAAAYIRSLIVDSDKDVISTYKASFATGIEKVKELLNTFYS